jgi:hypothetical protein
MEYNPPANDRMLNGGSVEIPSSDAYDKYYQQQWRLIARHFEGQYVAVHTEEDMQRLMQQLASDLTRQDIFTGLKAQVPSPGDEACDNSINLAGRLLVMLKIGVVKHQAAPRGYLDWTEGSLKEFVHSCFVSPPKLSCDQVRLPKAFNIWSIAEVAGIEISFTNNLADHLLLVEEDTKLLIFHHVFFLQQQKT